MGALLILGGLLLMLSGLVWLVMRAFASSLLWGLGSLLPPISLLYVLRYWRKARSPVGLFALGCIPLVVGLALLANQDADRLRAILSLDWLKPAAQAPSELDIQLHGQLHGQPFAPQHAELINGVLSLREGQGFFARREVTIRLPQGLQAPIRLDVLPEDRGQLPEVEVSWLLPEQDLPEARRLSQGYSLHLDLQALPPNKLSGDFHLVLPAQYGTALSGRLELFSDHLRYRNGQLNTAFDSQQTLARVVDDYLQRRFATRLVQLLEVPAVSFPASHAQLAIAARINGRQQRLELVLEKGIRGWRVVGDRYPALPQALNAPAAKAVVQASAPSEPSKQPLDRRQRFSLLRLLSNPQQYQNLSMRIVKLSGGLAEGRFAGLDSAGRIRLSQQHGGAGQATFTLHPDEISRIELLEP